MKTRPQTVPKPAAAANPPQEMVGVTGSNPVAPTSLSLHNSDNPLHATQEKDAVPAGLREFRPQSSPKARGGLIVVLRRQEVQYLVGVLERERGYWTLHQEPGRQADTFARRLRKLL